jgi:hypothetical protein
MTAASVSILFPALGRLMTNSGFDGAFAVIPYAALLAAIAGFDLVVLRRLHQGDAHRGRGGLAKVTSYLPVGASAPWHAVKRASGRAVGPLIRQPWVLDQKSRRSQRGELRFADDALERLLIILDPVLQLAAGGRRQRRRHPIGDAVLEPHAGG